MKGTTALPGRTTIKTQSGVNPSNYFAFKKGVRFYSEMKTYFEGTNEKMHLHQNG